MFPVLASLLPAADTATEEVAPVVGVTGVVDAVAVTAFAPNTVLKLGTLYTPASCAEVKYSS